MKRFVLFSTVLTVAGALLWSQTPIGKTETAVTIDGSREAAWDAAPKYLAVDPHSWCYDGWIAGWFGREVTMQSETDLSLNWSAMWDATNLYLFLEFKDDVVTTGDVANMGADEKLWMMDCAEVKIGDNFYRFGYDRDDEIFQRPNANPPQLNPGGYTQASVTITGGYAIEVQIPWSTLTEVVGSNPDVETTFMIWVSGADLDNPAGKLWNDQDGHIHFPYDGGMEEITLALAAPIDATPPAAPANTTAVDVTLTSATIAWDAVADADLKGYILLERGVAQAYLRGLEEKEVALEIDNTYSYTVKSYDGQNLSSASEAAVVSTVPASGDIAIGKTGTPVIVDGTREATWDVAPQYVAVDPTTWTPNPDHQSLADCSFKWSALWDEDSLYLFVSIMDDTPTTGDIATEGSSAKSWMNDNIEVSVAPIDGEGTPWFFRFGYNREPEDLGLLDDPAKNTPVGSRYATADMEGGWALEAAIPWKILSIDPENFTGWAVVDSSINIGIYAADLDDPTATAWDKLSGHVQWPRGWSTADVVLKNAGFIDEVTPAAPTGLSAAEITITGAILSWNPSPEEDVTGYLVLKGDAPVLYTALTSAEVSGLTAETQYSFSVIAVDVQNLSDESAAVEFTTISPPSLKSISVPKYSGSYPNPFDDLELWEGLPGNDVAYGLDEEHDFNDFKVYFKTMWDDDNLYVQINLVDPPPVINGKENPWENDNTEVHFDLQNAKDGTSCEDVDGDLYQKDNMQYRFIAFEPERQHGSTPAPNWTNLTQVDYELYDDAGTTVIGWYVEVTFPWATLNLTADGFFTFTPAIGEAIGVEIHAFDYDEDGDNNFVQWSSYSELPPNRDNTEYGTFVLGNPLAIGNQDVQTLKVYPNPAQDEIRLTVPGEGYVLTISDMTGRTVLHEPVLNPGMASIDISGLDPGIYMVSMQNGTSYHCSKLIRE
jgi:hypothetical protein